ncbi:MAG: phosphohistidine phosphatase SixA [Gammaproteobacteria bacterium]|nr:phosphohistidine phosphatase SixA [Gammaproteobacteria bacterium]
MHLFVMRHGDAFRQLTNDRERRLTERGRQEVTVSAGQLVGSNVNLERICCSPLFRARETAEIVQSLIPCEAEIEVWEEIMPGGRCETVAQRLNNEPMCATLMVSHQPFVGRMIAWLTREEINMDTGMIACIQANNFDQFCGELEWTGPDTRY